MCGIAGIAFFNPKKEVHLSHLKRMSAKIAHRGPDSEGYYLSKNKNVGFVHKRLSIIDLTEGGHQPMIYQNRYVIIFNGEIYNFQSLKQKLVKNNFKFQSQSDTEVILALYSKYRQKCLKFLRGMFAFAIYDIYEQTLFLARDRIGKKPLKYVIDDNKIIFASELKAILEILPTKPQVDYLAIQKYFLYGYLPSPFTGFKNIAKLEPGHYIFIDLKRKIFNKQNYWQPRFKKKLNFSEKEWSRKILQTLEESTKLRMISDVPLGAFLSGGVDSSAVVAMMALNSKNPIKTFSIIFDDPKYSEKKYADLIVKKYKTDHSEIIARPTSVFNLPEIAYQYEEPFSDNSSVISFLVSKEARKQVTVTLNGDGGDENFAGYPNRYLRLKRDIDYEKWITIARPLSALKIKKVSKFLNKSNLPIYERFVSYNQIFPIAEILEFGNNGLKDVMTYDNLYQKVREAFDNFQGKDLKDAGLKFDLLYFLPDQLLAKMDIASMRYSLETRSPFLDHKMIELACKIPFNLKVKNGETKYILKKALEQIVPKENLYRPKMGFTIPLEEWFKGDLKKYSQKIIYSKKSLIRNLININKLKLDNENKRWSILMLELWLQNYFQ